MPHIIVEVTPGLAESINFVPVFLAIHQRISGVGEAALDDFKSRLHVADQCLAGADREAEFVVARLVTTRPRTKAMQQDMARVVHDILRDAIEAEPRPYWWQCCVLVETFDLADYIKTDSRRTSLSSHSAF